MSAARKRKRGVAGTTEQQPYTTVVARDVYGIAKVLAACTECRKQKTKCDLPNGEPPCSRCQRKSLHCLLHSPARTASTNLRQVGLLQDDVSNLHGTIKRVCEHLALDPPDPLASGETSRAQSDRPPIVELDGVDGGLSNLSPPVSPSAIHAPIDTWLDRTTGKAPLKDSKHCQNPNSPKYHDLVSKGLISREKAELLVHRYLSRFDHFLYGIANHHQNLDAIRRASPTLLAVICAVAALHDAENPEVFELCNTELKYLIASAMFERRDSEYIRALCIGSFWLLGSSRILSSDAIRRAADTRLHRHFYRICEHEPADTIDCMVDARDSVRLWYMLYICDQHLSILHNRDCLTRSERKIIEDRELFLESQLATSRDVRIVSQVSLLQIMCQIRDVFGSERREPLSKSLVVQFSHFSRELDQYHAKYSGRFEPDPDIGDFPTVGLNMHYQFARLYLGHYVFRGLDGNPIPLHFLPAANNAYEAAMAIFNMILDLEILRNNLVGVPHYFHVMISFAGHLLLEVCIKHREQLEIAVEDDLRRIGAVLAHFVQVPTLPQHPLTTVTTGLMRRLSECTRSLGINSVMIGTPYGTLEEPYTTTLHPGTNIAHNPSMPANTPNLQPVDMPVDEFSFSDFGNFPFQDLPLDFAL